MVKQPGTKHHGITKKLKQGFIRSEAHRRALATTAQPRRRSCRPRGRRAWSASSRQSQASRMVRLSTQGISRAVASVTEDWRVQWRRQKLNGVRLRRREKIEEEEKRRRRRLGTYNVAQKLKEATTESFPVPARRHGQPRRAWKQAEGRRRCSESGEHCSQYLQDCHSL